MNWLSACHSSQSITEGLVAQIGLTLCPPIQQAWEPSQQEPWSNPCLYPIFIPWLNLWPHLLLHSWSHMFIWDHHIPIGIKREGERNQLYAPVLCEALWSALCIYCHCTPATRVILSYLTDEDMEVLSSWVASVEVQTSGAFLFPNIMHSFPKLKACHLFDTAHST